MYWRECDSMATLLMLSVRHSTVVALLLAQWPVCPCASYAPVCAATHIPGARPCASVLGPAPGHQGGVGAGAVDWLLCQLHV